MICCKKFNNQGPVNSPFQRMLAVGYFDGATEGFIECSICKETYAFKMIDWDDNQDIRIFTISPLYLPWIEIVEHVLPNQGLERPFLLASSLTSEQKVFVNQQFTIPPTRIDVAYDLQKELLFWLNYREEDIVAGTDWFTRLQLLRHGV